MTQVKFRRICMESSNSIFYDVTLQYSIPLACVASVSVCFRSKEDRGGRFSVLTAREMKRELKNALFYLRHYSRGLRLSFLVPRSSFFAHRPHRNACYAGYYSLLQSERVKLQWNLDITNLNLTKSSIKENDIICLSNSKICGNKSL